MSSIGTNILINTINDVFLFGQGDMTHLSVYRKRIKKEVLK